MVLGVDITIKKSALNICKGLVQVSRMVIHQPVNEKHWERDAQGKMKGTETGRTFKCPGDEGFDEEADPTLKWKENYVAKVDLLLIKVNLWRLVTTLGKEFQLENLSIKGIHFNVEKPTADLKVQNSNVEYILNYVDELGLIPAEEEAAAATQKVEAEVTKVEGEEAKPEEPAQDLDMPKVILNKICLGDIGAGVSIRGVHFPGSKVDREIAFHPSIGLIEFEDIQRDIFGGREDLTPSETVGCIIKAVSNKIFVKVIKEFPAALKGSIQEAAGKTISNVKNAASKAFQGLSSAFHKNSAKSVSAA